MNESVQSAMAAPTSNIVHNVETILKYAKSRHASLPIGSTLIEKQYIQVVHYVRAAAATLTHAEAMVLHALMAEYCPPFDESHASRLGSLTDELLSGGDGVGASSHGSGSQQVHGHIHNYLGTRMWTMLNGESPSVTSKLEILCRFFIDTLHLRNPDEPTRASAVALVMACSGCDLDKKVAHAHVVQVRHFMKHIRPFMKGIRGPKTYPEDPVHFRDMYLDTKLFTDDPPVACGLNIIRLMDLYSWCPQRSSNRAIRSTASSSSMAKHESPSSSGDHMAEFGSFLMGNHIASSLHELPTLKGWLENRTQSAAPLTDGTLHIAPPLSAPKHEAMFNTPEAKAKFEPLSSPTRDIPLAPLVAVDVGTSRPSAPASDCMAELDAACRESLGASLDPSMVPAAQLHGDLTELRVDQSIAARFVLGLPKPKAPSSRKRKTHIDKAPASKYRLKSKTQVGSYVTRDAPTVMMRPAAMIIDPLMNPGWEVRTHFRNTLLGPATGKPYYDYRHPDGVRYQSKKQACAHGFKVS